MLECRACAVRRVNGQIYNLLPYLVQLDLGYNGMPFMSDDDFVDLKRLQILKLDGNMFPVVLERTFVNQGELRSLNLAGNRLAKITNTAFLNMSSLEDLDISYNQLYKMESEIMLPVASTLRRLVSILRRALKIVGDLTEKSVIVEDFKMSKLSTKLENLHSENSRVFKVVPKLIVIKANIFANLEMSKLT